MKKIIFGAAVILALGLTGCTREIQREINNWTYTNPKKEDARYTVYQNGHEFPVHHLKCIYWSTDDDDSVFEAENGKKIFVNGSSIIVEE
jgi:hypothetical protein